MTLNQITKVKGPGIHTQANIVSNSISLGGIATASNFKTGTTNIHSAGVEAAGINVLGADTPIGTGATIYNSGAAVFTGVVTATKFVGQADITGGSIVGTSATFTGNVSIGGTLTYEDVTNIDSVGIVTARAGIKVTGGNVELLDDRKLRLGTGNDLNIYHENSSTTNWIEGTGLIRIQTVGNIEICPKNGAEKGARFVTDGAAELYFNGSKKFETTADGATVTGALNLTGASSGNYINVGSSTVYANAAINIHRNGNGYADMRLASNYGAKVALAGASNNTDEFFIQQDNQKNAYIYNEAAKDIIFGTSNTERLRILSSGNISVGSNGAAAEKFQVNGGNIAIVGGTSYKIDTHPLVSYASFTDISGGTYAARLGSTGSSTIRSTQIYGGGSHIATFDGVNYRLGIKETTPEEILDLGENNQQNLKVGQRGYLGQAYSTSATILGHSVKAKTTGTTASGMIVTETNSGGGAPSAIRQVSGTIQFHTASSGTADADFDNERLRIDSSGKVGIATETPRAKFDVRPGGHSGDGAITFNTGIGEVGSSNNAIQSINGTASALQPLGYRATEHIFATQSAERLRILSNGKMGLGTNNPTQYFHVVGNSASVQTEESGGGIVRMQSGGSVGYVGTYSNHPLLLLTNSQERLRIASGGGVGISTTLIHNNRFLHIAAPSQAYDGASTNLMDGGGICFQGTDNSFATGRTYPGIFWTGNTASLGRARAGIIGRSAANNDATDIVFLTRSAADGTPMTPADEKMRLDKSGILWHYPSNTSEAYGKWQRSGDTYQLRVQKNGSVDTNFAIQVQDGGSLKQMITVTGGNKHVAIGPSITPARNLHVQEHILVGNIGTNGGQPYVSSKALLTVTTDGSNVVPGDTTYRHNALVSFGVGGHNNGNPGSNTLPGLGYFKLDLYGQTGLGDVGTNLDSTLSIRSINPNNTRLRIRTKDNYNGTYPDASISFTQQQSTEIARILCDTYTSAANRADLAFYTNYGGLYERLRIKDTGKVSLNAVNTSHISMDGSANRFRIQTEDKDAVFITQSQVLSAAKVETKCVQYSSVNTKYFSNNNIKQFSMVYYTGASSATYHVARFISQTDWGFDNVTFQIGKYQYNPTSDDLQTQRYSTYYSSHSKHIINYNQYAGGTGTGNWNVLHWRQDFGPSGAHQIHQASNGGYYRDCWGSDLYINLGTYTGIRLLVTIWASTGTYDTGNYATAYDFYPANYGGTATQTNANNWNGPRGVWFNTTTQGTGTGSAHGVLDFTTGDNYGETSAT